MPLEKPNHENSEPRREVPTGGVVGVHSAAVNSSGQQPRAPDDTDGDPVQHDTSSRPPTETAPSKSMQLRQTAFEQTDPTTQPTGEEPDSMREPRSRSSRSSMSAGGRHGLIDPVEARPAALVPGLVDILTREGPMTGQNLHQSFVKAIGGQRVGSRARKNLNKAIRIAITKGSIEKRDELGAPGYKGQILRNAGASPVNVRPRGDREFLEIPPSEVATVMKQLEEATHSLPKDELFRKVLERFDTVRMTRSIEERLNFIQDKRDALAG